MLQKIKKVVSIIDETCFSVSTVVLSVLTVVAVFMRFVIKKPIQWTEEVQMILVVWSVFFGGSIASREKGHVIVDMFVDRMPEKAQNVVEWIIWFVVTGCLVAIIRLEIKRCLDLVSSGLRTPILRIPSSIDYFVVVFACFLMLISHTIAGIETLKEKREGAEK